MLPNTPQQVKFCDIGCGYGGLLVTLSPMFPETYMVGFEIRVKVSDYVNDRSDVDIFQLMWAFYRSHSSRNKLPNIFQISLTFKDKHIYLFRQKT